MMRLITFCIIPDIKINSKATKFIADIAALSITDHDAVQLVEQFLEIDSRMHRGNASFSHCALAGLKADCLA
jgi:hypothetical protein